MPKNYKPEMVGQQIGDTVASRDEESIRVGRGTKGPSLHGKHTLEDKKAFTKNEANEIDLDENMALDIRKANVLDYIEGGGDGRGDEVESRIQDFKNMNPELIIHHEVDELYPKGE